MPAGGRKVGSRNKDSRKILAALPEFLSPSRRVTVRYCLYQLVSRGLILSTSDAHYSKLSSLLRAVRVSGELDGAFAPDTLDDCFVDNHCKTETGGDDGWENIAEYMEPSDPEHYRRNRWQDQPKHVTEIWLEKDTTAVLVRPVVRKWDCTLRISAGAYGRAFLVKAANALAEVEKPITILCVGDFDPKGLDIERAAKEANNQNKVGDDRREGLFDILKTKHDWTAQRIQRQITWERVAATHADLVRMEDKYKITAKQSGVDEVTGETTPGDSTAPAYVAQYGELCLEVEALEVVKVGELAARLETAILKHGVNQAAWKRSEVKQKREIETWISSGG